jgi:predicted AAA+ superfamily ATPase
LRWTHWSFAEMRGAFGWDLDRFVFFGGYPGAAPLVDDEPRWRAYVTDSLIETSISRDVLLLTRVDKPVLLRQLFHLACDYSGQIVAYDKLVGQLAEAGNTTTLAHYLRLLEGAGLIAGVPKYSGSAVRRRASSPRLQVLNTALMGALSTRSFEQVRADSATWGRYVESAVGAHLLAWAPEHGFAVRYWRQGHEEVDFVLERGDELLAIEVKSGAQVGQLAGLEAFRRQYHSARPLQVGGDGIGIEALLGGEVELGG